VNILTIIVITLFIAITINIILKKIHLPTIIGYILTGIIITYSFDLQNAVHNHTLLQIAEFGVVFLMFTIGLEFSANKLKSLKYEVFVLGNLQIFITGIVVFILSYFVLNLDGKTSLIIALIASLSSTAIVLKILNSNKEINRNYGRLSLSILLMQDLFVIPALLIIGFLSSDDKSFASSIVDIVLGGAALTIILWLIAKYLLEPFFNQIVKTTDDELFVGTILFLAIGSSYLAHTLGFSYSLGAFIAGMLIAETKYKHQAEADLVPFRDLLLGVFFITIGMQIDFAIIFDNLWLIIGGASLIMALKFNIIFAIIRFNFNKRPAIKTALALMQIGEFSLALLELSRVNNLLNENISQIVLAIIVLSMIITPIILKNVSKIADLFIHDDEKDESCPQYNIMGHVVLIGFGTLGQNIAAQLRNNNLEYIAIENNINIFHKFKDKGENIIFGNAAQKNLMRQAKIVDASSVIVAIDNPDKLYGVCHNLVKFVDNEKIIVKLHSRIERDIIAEFGLKNIIIENDLTSRKIIDLLQQD
jgi:CPA2 family monovalent cation:H+ antiporter-2